MGSPDDAHHYDAVLREAARSLAKSLAPYRTLTRDDLLEVSGVDRWRTIDFDAALDAAVGLGLVRRLGDDLYEVPRDRADG
jgi:hypothetical protein